MLKNDFDGDKLNNKHTKNQRKKSVGSRPESGRQTPSDRAGRKRRRRSGSGGGTKRWERPDGGQRSPADGNVSPVCGAVQ